MLLEPSLFECSKKFVDLNVSREVFKPVVINDDGNEEELTNYFVDVYKTRALCMEDVSLIDGARS